ncbi:MAG: EmrB/QacA family drug resistance transporter, partial [Chloroflexota bacterium]|nr:EmrB/QacA family drug resistance transporter [Chloroflexota bacterium]
SLGLLLLSRTSMETSTAGALGIMLVLGLGLGIVMQVLVIAVQNAVDYRELGVATSGATLFRLIGGSLGTAVLGAIFATRLEVNLARFLPAGSGGLPGGRSGVGMNLDALAHLPPAVRAAYTEAFTASLGTVFPVATGIAVIGFLLAWLLPERPLRETVAAAAAEVGSEVGEAFPMPTDPDPLPQLLRGLAALADRDVQRRYIERIVERAGVDLTPAAAWLLVRIERDPVVDPYALGRTHRVDSLRIEAAMRQLRDCGLVVETLPETGHGPRRVVTAAGCEMLGRLVAARRARLAELLAEWAPEQREEVAELLRRFARELVPEAPPTHTSGGVSGLGTSQRT